MKKLTIPVRQKRAVTVFLFAAGGITAIAMASPPANFSGTALAVARLVKNADVNSARIVFQTNNPTDTSVVRLDFAAGGDSGWHHHPGMVLVQVAEGTVKVYDSSCAFKTYGVGAPAGSVFVEGKTVHKVTSAAGAVAYATAVVVKETPPVFRVEDQVPFCDAK
ncbi:MAG: hypothetical protein ABIW16_06535 [Sphingomicrobium sp.]